VDELRGDLAEKIRRVKNLSQGAAARDKVLEALLGMTEVAVPESIVKGEIEVREHDAIHSFNHDDEAFAAYLEREGKSREEFDAEIRSAAEDAVRTQLLLDAMAEAEGIGVNQDEFTERVIYNAQRFGMSPDEYFKRLQEGNQLASVFADVRRGKALAGAVGRATISDASGNRLDIDELFGIEDDPEVDVEAGSGVDADEAQLAPVDRADEATSDQQALDAQDTEAAERV
jgi:trigger factor